MKKLVVVCLMLVTVALPSVSSAIGLEVAAGLWNQSPGGDIRYNGDTLDVKSDLGYGNQTRFTGRAKIDMPLIIPNIYLMATPMSFDGSGSKSAAFTFGSKTFTASAPYTSELSMDHYDVALYYGVPFLGLASLGKLNVDAGLNLRFVNLDAKIDQPSTNLHESKSFTLPVPMVYVAAQVTPIERLALEAELRAIAYNSNHFYDFIARVKYKALKLVLVDAFIAGGYRYESINIDAKDVKAGINVGGPFVELGVEF